MENYGRLRKNAPQETNSMNKFVQEFSQRKTDGDFLRAHDILAPTNFSKLSLKRPATTKLAPIFNKENFPRIKRKPTVASPGQFGTIEYLPVPTQKKLPVAAVNKDEISSVDSKLKLGRKLVFITGNVQFISKTYKLYPDLPALYEVYGNIMKVCKGKIRFEHKIIIRSESGPVLQGLYFDFYNTIDSFSTNSIRCVGQFTGQNRFHIHKIQETPAVPSDSVLTRVQNVSAFALLQIQKK